MSKTPVPKEIKLKLLALVQQEATESNYLTSTITEKNQLIDKLSKMPTIGGVLSSYLDSTKIRSFIKDNLLRKYSLTTQRSFQPSVQDYIDWCIKHYNVNDLESCNTHNSFLYLLKSKSSSLYIVIAKSTYKRWETALRYALIFLAEKPFANSENNIVHILLSLTVGDNAITEPDKNLLLKALKRANASARFI